MRWGRWIFAIAGLYGLVVLVPQFFWEARIARETPPAISHPEFYYGFLGVAVAWQVAFLQISRDPPRYRPIMVAAILEKVSFGAAACVLYWQGRLAAQMFAAGLIDLLLAALFVVAFLQSMPATAPTR